MILSKKLQELIWDSIIFIQNMRVKLIIYGMVTCFTQEDTVRNTNEQLKLFY